MLSVFPVPAQHRKSSGLNYLLDTDWAISHLHNFGRTVQRLAELAPEGIGISIVSVAELYDGVINGTSPERDDIALRVFLTGFEIIDLDMETCRIFAREKGRLRTAGMPIGDFDLLIGAPALRHNLTLLTSNRRHFERLTALNIISA